MQDRLYVEGAQVAEVYKLGARLYVCGSAAMCEGVMATGKEIYRVSKPGSVLPTSEQVDVWFASTKENRYVSDVFDRV